MPIPDAILPPQREPDELALARARDWLVCYRKTRLNAEYLDATGERRREIEEELEELWK